MNIEDLSKSQLLLLTVLVNFVVGIATSVLTVSLLDEAPPTVTQTINRIVEHTIETVTPSPQATTETVVVNNEEFRTAAIAENVARTVTLSKSGGAVLGTGTYLSAERAVVTFVPESDAPWKEAQVAFPDGSVATARLLGRDGGVTVYRFEEGAALPAAPSGVFVAPEKLAQGQTVIGLTADGSAVVGIVSKIDAGGIYTSLPGMPAGSSAVNLDGDIVGIAALSPGVYLPGGKIAGLLASP